MDGLDLASATSLVLDASEVQERTETTIRQAEQIADALDCHPLAMTVASALVQSSIYSLEWYALALKDRLTQKELLNVEIEQATYRKVSTTFEMSANVLQELAAADPSAHDALALLDLLAFMHNQGVSEDMFVRAWDYEETVLSLRKSGYTSSRDLSMWHVAQSRKYFPCRNVAERTRALKKARAHLVRLTLIKHDIACATVHVHPLLHLWARERLQHASKAWAAAASILALAAEGCQRRQPYSEQLSLHCDTNFRLKQVPRGIQLQSEVLCRIWCNFSWQMILNDQDDMAGLLLKEVRSHFTTDMDDMLLAELEHQHGFVLLNNGENTQAATVLEGVVKMRAELHRDHPERLLSQVKLADAYSRCGRSAEAIEILEHVGQINGSLAADHPNRLTFEVWLACAYLANGQIPRAIAILEHVTELHEETAADSRAQLEAQVGLAHAYLEDAQFSRVIAVVEPVLRAQKKLSVNNTSRLANEHLLARAYLEVGPISRAIELF